MYTIDDIEKEIEKDFEKHEMGNVLEELKKDCREILECQDINDACERISIIRKVYRNTQKLPSWFKKLVFLTIYNYLYPMYLDSEMGKYQNMKTSEAKSNRKQYKTQTELLDMMGLAKDIFREKHWDMYSPDMKARQQLYMSMELPLNYAEVECNDVYRAMIHYMTSYSDIQTDTFVDVFGKLGLPAMFCANGYNKREVWVEDARLFELFSDAMKHNSMKVYKRIAEIQKLLIRNDYKQQKQVIQELLDYYWIKQIVYARRDNTEIDKIEFAAGFFFINCFSPEYWLDSMREIKEDSNGERYVDEELKTDKITRYKVKRFIALEKADFRYWAKQYKKISFIEIDKMHIIKSLNDEYYFNTKFQNNQTDMLYIDIPKYIREYNRFNFSSKKMVEILKLLERYSGNWILTWKNYVEKKFDSTGTNMPRNQIYTGERSEDMNDIVRVINVFTNIAKVYHMGKTKGLDIRKRKGIYNTMVCTISEAEAAKRITMNTMSEKLKQL